MYKLLWDRISAKKCTVEKKQRLFIAEAVLVYAFIGILFWLIIGALVWIFAEKDILTEVSWALCFAGYPAVFAGFFGGVIYLYSV